MEKRVEDDSSLILLMMVDYVVKIELCLCKDLDLIHVLSSIH